MKTNYIFVLLIITVILAMIIALMYSSIVEAFNDSIEIGSDLCRMHLTPETKQLVMQKLTDKLKYWNDLIDQKKQLIANLKEEAKKYQNIADNAKKQIQTLTTTMNGVQNRLNEINSNLTTTNTNMNAYKQQFSFYTTQINYMKDRLKFINNTINRYGSLSSFQNGLHWMRVAGQGNYDNVSSVDYFKRAPIVTYGTISSIPNVDFAFPSFNNGSEFHSDKGRSNANNWWNYDQTYAMEFKGYFKPSSTGTWAFWTESDDGSHLWIGNIAMSGYQHDNAIVRNGGLHPKQWSGGSIYLIKDVLYPIRIQFNEWTGHDNLKVLFAGPGVSQRYDGSGYFFNTGNGFNTTLMNKYNAKILSQSISSKLYWRRVNGGGGIGILASGSASATGTVDNINAIGFAYGRPGVATPTTDRFSVEVTGYFKPSETGDWVFKLYSDDDSWLWIGNNAINDYNTGNVNIGIPSWGQTKYATLRLDKDVMYPMRIQYSNSGGGPCDLVFAFSGPGVSERTDGNGYFFNTQSSLSSDVINGMNSIVLEASKLQSNYGSANSLLQKFQNLYSSTIANLSSLKNNKQQLELQVLDYKKSITNYQTQYNENIAKLDETNRTIRNEEALLAQLQVKADRVKYYINSVVQYNGIPMDGFMSAIKNTFTYAHHEKIMNDQFIGNMARCYQYLSNPNTINEIKNQLRETFADSIKVDQRTINNKPYLELTFLTNDVLKYIPVL